MKTQIISGIILLIFFANIYFEWREDGGVFWPIALGFAKTIILCAAIFAMLFLAVKVAGVSL